MSFILAVRGFKASPHPPHPLGPNALPPQQTQSLDLLAQALTGIAIGIGIGSAGLLAWTTRQLEDSAANEDEQQPPELSEQVSQHLPLSL
jgi:hypothetical protein